MAPQDINKIVIAGPILRREGAARGEALNQQPRKEFPGLTPGSPEWNQAVAYDILLNGAWVSLLSQTNTLGTSWYVDALLGQSCREIVIAPANKEQFAALTEELSPLAKRHVKYAGHDDLYYAVKAYLLPVAKELVRLGEYNPATPRVPPTQSRRDDAHPLVQLAGEIYLLAIASAEKAQLDGSLARFESAIQKLRSYDLSSDSRTRIALLEGVVKFYMPQEVAHLSLAVDVSQRGVGERLLHLLDESIFLDLSAEWYKLGHARARRATLRRIKVLCSDIVRRRKWKPLVELAAQTVMLVTPVSLPGARLLDFLSVETYSPALVDMDNLKVRPFSGDIPDRESILKSLKGVSFADAAFVDAKMAEGTLTMHWDVFTESLLPDFSFTEDLN
jgi:hypothetical protein